MVTVVKNLAVMNIAKIALQVMNNCEISNARNWGTYSVCGLLMRLTELYRWEKGIAPWNGINHSALLDWVDEQEKRWEAIGNREFRDIEINEKKYPPFSVEEINCELRGRDYLYGAGYVGALKSSFFLAELEKTYEEEGFEICILGREHARDLVSYPAMLQGKKILGRTQSLSYFLWEKLLEARASASRTILRSAFEDYGIDFTIEPEMQIEAMKTIVSGELEALLHHEIGEALDTVFPSNEWASIINAFPQSKIEHLTRGIKDLLADTHEKGMLSYIIREKKLGSLGFYASLVFGYRKLLMPGINEVYRRVKKEADWGVAEDARREGLEKAKEYAEALLDIYSEKERGKKWVEQEIIGKLVKPLKI